MTIQEMKARKKELGYTNQQIAKLSGIPLSTVQKVFTGETKSPRYDTLQALYRVLSEESGDNVQKVAEILAAYGSGTGKHPGSYTLDDYYAIPDEYRVELIDGVIYDMAAPTLWHQRLIGELHYQIQSFIRSQRESCKVYFSPIDVQLDQDNKTMVQPDLVILCNPELNHGRCIFGAPEFVLEVVSPGSGKRDYIIKTHKYMEAGTREYWIVDPYKKLVLVYYFEDENAPMIYPMNQRIPVRMYDGKLEIDFTDMEEFLPA
ncbi:MAG: Uma2 family endonuclease [Lachnospiraceae bacterium]|nr:Uma2 family endonuclease [Lachnospiraceae bacterium]